MLSTVRNKAPVSDCLQRCLVKQKKQIYLVKTDDPWSLYKEKEVEEKEGE